MIKLGKLLIQVVIVIAVASSVAFAQALQEIRIGSSAIGFSSLTTYFARDFKFFEKEGLDAKIIYVDCLCGS
jgi:ABC-type nitrate/sulfonate/bicarbonate transport system substrate-binding protein